MCFCFHRLWSGSAISRAWRGGGEKLGIEWKWMRRESTLKTDCSEQGERERRWVVGFIGIFELWASFNDEFCVRFSFFFDKYSFSLFSCLQPWTSFIYIFQWRFPAHQWNIYFVKNDDGSCTLQRWTFSPYQTAKIEAFGMMMRKSRSWMREREREEKEENFFLASSGKCLSWPVISRRYWSTLALTFSISFLTEVIDCDGWWQSQQKSKRGAAACCWCEFFNTTHFLLSSLFICQWTSSLSLVMRFQFYADISLHIIKLWIFFLFRHHVMCDRTGNSPSQSVS